MARDSFSSAVLMVGMVLSACVLPAVAGPPRPGPGDGSNFHVHAGFEWLDYRLDPRGADDFVAAGLDPRAADPQVFLGVGWVFARPLRLGLSVGGGQLDVGRPGTDCALGRVQADLHLAVLEAGEFSVEATASLGAHAIVYSGLPDDEPLAGGEVGLGGTLGLPLPGPLGLTATYRWQRVRFGRTVVELDQSHAIDVHPTATSHGVRVLLTWDL